LTRKLGLAPTRQNNRVDIHSSINVLDAGLITKPRWYIEGQSVVRVLAILTICIATTTLFPSGFAVEPVNSIFQ